jgi:hypothetical protein
MTYLPLTKDNLIVGARVICRYRPAFPSSSFDYYGKTGVVSWVAFWG